MFITKIHIPSVLQGTLKSVGGTVAPISMIITGMIMAGAELKKGICEWKNLFGFIF